MKKLKTSKSKKKSKLSTPKFKTPDFCGYESFSNTHGPLVIYQLDDLYHKDLMNKKIDWIIFGDNAVPRKETIECEFAFVKFNTQHSGWDHAPHTRDYSRKFKAVRYQKY